MRLELDGTTLLTDPLLRRSLGPLQRHGAPPTAAGLGHIDIVLLSHGHPDHLDPESLAAVPGSPTVVVPRGLGRSVERYARGRVVEVEAGESTSIAGLRIEGVEATHWIAPGAPRAKPLGYLVEGTTTTYFAGDTGRHPGLPRLEGLVDLALLPVWTWGPHLGPGHLGPRAAAEVLAGLRAPAAVPIHWGTLYPRRLHHVIRAPLREPGQRFASYAAAAAPHADVRVLHPGDETSFELRRRR